MKRRRVSVAACLLSAACMVGCSDPYSGAGALPPSVDESSPEPGGTEARGIDAQDRVSKQHRDREQEAMAERPMLDRLPLRVGEVRMSIAGLAKDGRSTIIEVDAGAGSRRAARAAYRRALKSFGDRGVSYEPRFIGGG